MFLKQMFWIVGVLVLLLGTGRSTAQDTPTLRELAEQNNIYIGTAVYTYHLDDPVHVETLGREFNMLTPENEAKACVIQPEQGKFNFEPFDELVAFAEDHDMVVHGHTLVWHQCMPDWLQNGDFSREEAIQILKDHISTVVGHYKGRVKIWDVVNEAIAGSGTGLRETPWQRWIGDDYLDLAFQFAHEADPDALLFYNDYGAEGIGAKSDAVYELVKGLVERDVPINGVGLQMHITVKDTVSELGGRVAPEKLRQNIERLGELGLQVQITEMDVAFLGQFTEEIRQQQAGDFRRVMETCLNTEACTAFITWGVSDKLSWLRDPQYSDNPNNAPLLFDESYQPKPAYYAVLDLLARQAGLEPILSDDEVAVMMSSTGAAADIPEPTKSDPAQLAPDSVPGVAYYAPFPVAITLDGQTDDWANIPRVTVDSGPVLPADNDTSMIFAVAADAKMLYFLAEVQDSKLVYGTHDPASEWYLEDSVEFYLNTTGDLKLAAYEPGVVQLGLPAANLTQPEQPLFGGGNSADAQVSVVAVETETGYRVEASVPLLTKVWLLKPKHLKPLGFQVALNGSSGTDRDTKLIWSVYDTQDQSWSNPSLFGQLIFWDVKR
ncbi:MAG TPA: endo-1,4-beta-xylanase [Phototrophicaceae bacterium]|nr:endo-1,4-beta-xylanase [Phototrophicaceae bacterium]